MHVRKREDRPLLKARDRDLLLQLAVNDGADVRAAFPCPTARFICLEMPVFTRVWFHAFECEADFDAHLKGVRVPGFILLEDDVTRTVGRAASSSSVC